MKKLKVFCTYLDPKDPKNAAITDIEFAPLNDNGRVEYAADFKL